MEKIKESTNKDLEESKNKHTDTNATIVEIKNSLEGIAEYLKLENKSMSWKKKW